MAVKPNADRSSRRSRLVIASLLVLFVAALFLRAYWNLDAAVQDGEFVLSAGSDPYYHKRAIDFIQANGYQTLIEDPMLNYPMGAINPNPPLFQWSVAIAGHLMAPFFSATETMSAEQVATWYAFLWSPAVFGALTLIPIYFIGKTLFGRTAGVLGALFWTISTSSIDMSGVGAADHDPVVMLFVATGFLFYIKALEQFKGDGNWVAAWGDSASRGSGLSRFFRERRLGMMYSLLTGVSIAAVALTWKGFPYMIGIMFAYAGLQMVIDHWRSKDSTGVFIGTFIAMLTGVLIALPYYLATDLGNFLRPVWFLLAGFFIGGLVLVPTRDMPTILVMPAALVVAAIGGIIAFFVFPEVAQGLLYATVYFKQTALYETIAEAHPADFSTFVFSIGPLPYFLGLIGWFYLLFTGANERARAGIATAAFAVAITAILIVGLLIEMIAARFVPVAADPIATVVNFLILLGLVGWFATMLGMGGSAARPISFALVWAAVSVYMGHTAVRFVFNAIPIIAIFAGFGMARVLAWLDFGRIRRSIAASGGHTWMGFRKGLSGWHVAGALFIFLLLVVPNTMLAADAALPPSKEEQIRSETDSDFVRGFMDQRMGAYGQGFIPGYWADGLGWLDEYNSNITDPAERPGFLAWWDYGHWAIYVGRVPAVADNFQNGYEYAANFLLAQSEEQSIQLMAARLMPLLSEQQVVDILSAHGVQDPAAAREAMLRHEEVETIDLATSNAILADLEQATGKQIRYFTTDVRMLPYDNPQTPGFIEQSSIFYAPVRLAGDDPDDYVTHEINTGSRWVTVEQYRNAARDPINPVNPQGERLTFQPQFYNSMFYRGFVGTPPAAEPPTQGDAMLAALNNPAPGADLTHWRMIYQNDGLKTLEYTPGAIVRGTVTEEGTALGNVTVRAYDDAGSLIMQGFTPEAQAQFDADDFNVPHGRATTDANGNYEIIAPFALEGGVVTIRATDEEGNELGRTTLPITREEAQARTEFEGADITVRKGNVEGRAFEDVDNDGQYTEGSDVPAANTQITIGGVSANTDAAGNYTLSGVSSGTQSVTADNETLTVRESHATVRVRPDANVTHNVPLVPRPVEVTGTAYADMNGDEQIDEGEELGFTSLFFDLAEGVENNTAVENTAYTASNGAYSVSLAPGTYVVTGEQILDGAPYRVEQELVVVAGDAVTLDLRFTTG